MDLRDESFPKDFQLITPASKDINHKLVLDDKNSPEHNLQPIKTSKFKAKSCQDLINGASNSHKFKHVESRIKSYITRNGITGKNQQQKKFRRFNSMPETNEVISFENINSSEECETNVDEKDSEIDMLRTKVTMYERYFQEELEKNAKLEQKIDLMRRESKSESNLLSIPEFQITEPESPSLQITEPDSPAKFETSPCIINNENGIRRRIFNRKMIRSSPYEKFNNEGDEENSFQFDDF